MVGVRDGGTTETMIFVDGNLVAGPSSIPAVNVVGDADNRLLIGAGGIFEPFDGLIDEPMVFAGALGADQILALANADSSGTCAECSEPPGGMVSGTCAGSGQGFVGLIDEVEIHDRALSRDEVYAVYAAGAHGKCPLVDTVPDPFAFVDQANVDPATTITSNTVVVRGVNAATPITVSACTSNLREYAVNGGAWTAASGLVGDGDNVRVR